jgi:hypothetical protein
MQFGIGIVRGRRFERAGAEKRKKNEGIKRGRGPTQHGKLLSSADTTRVAMQLAIIMPPRASLARANSPAGNAVTLSSFRKVADCRGGSASN